MAISSKPEETPTRAGRRSTRVSLAIPIVLSGQDTDGKSFRENTRTAVVNKQGAKITTKFHVALGGEVTIENRAIGVIAKATVVWVGDFHNASEPVEIGVQLLAAQNIWGIVFPPEDWQDGPPIGIGGMKLEKAAIPAATPSVPDSIPSTAPAAPSVSTPSPNFAAGPTPVVVQFPQQPAKAPSASGPPAPSEVEIELPASFTKAAPAASPKAAPPPAQKAGSAPPRPIPAVPPAGALSDSVNAATDAALRKLTKDLDEAVDARLRTYGEKVIRFTNQFGLRVQANLQDAANRTEDRMVGLLEQRLGGLADRVQASQSAIENLMTRFEDLHQNTQALVESTEQKIRETSDKALQSTAQELANKLRLEVEAESSTLESQSQKRIQDKGAAAVESALQYAEERLYAIVQEGLRRSVAELQAQETRTITGANEQLNQITTAGVTEFHEQIGRMAGETAPVARAAMQESFQGAEADFLKQLHSKSAETAQAIRQDTEDHLTVLMEDCFRKSAAELKSQQAQAVHGVKEQMNQVTIAAGAAFQERLELIGADTMKSARGGMEESWEGSAAALIARAVQSLDQQTQVLAQDAVLTLQNSAQALQDRIQEESVKARRTCEEETARGAEAFARDLARQAEAAVSSLNLSAEQGIVKLRSAQVDAETALTGHLQSYQEQIAARSALALGQYSTELQNSLRGFQEGAARQLTQKLQSVAEDCEASAGEKIRSRVQNEAQAATETFSHDSKGRFAALAEEACARAAQQLKAQLTESATVEIGRVLESTSTEFAQTLAGKTREVARLFEQESRQELGKVMSELLQSSSRSLSQDGGQVANKLRTEFADSIATLGHEAEAKLNNLLQNTLERMTRETLPKVEEFRSRIHQEAQASRQSSLGDLEAGFKEAMERQRAIIADLFRQQAEQSRIQAALQTKTETEHIVAKATDALDKQLGRGGRMLAELGDQARASLETQMQKIEMEAKGAIWNLQKQIDQSSSASIDKFRREMGALVDEVVSRLHQSVRSFQGSTTEDLRAELQKASDNLLEVSAAQLRRQTEETLQTITEKLKMKEEEVANEATDIFRARIAEIFSILQPGPRRAREQAGTEEVKQPS